MNDALHICQLLKNASCSAEKALSTALQPLGITYCQATVLRRLSQGGVSMTELAEALCCNKSNITQIVQGLLRKKLLTKIVSSDDRRQLTLRLSTDGANTVKKINAALSETAPRCFCKLSAHEKEQLTKLLEACKECSEHVHA